MTITYKNLVDEEVTIELVEHDISKYKKLYHVTLKHNRAAIETEGLIRFKPQWKAVVQSGLLFFSYPIAENTSDLFRFYEDTNSIIVLDAESMHEDGFKFYDDPFSQKDMSSMRNHLCCSVDIPAKYIIKILEF